MVLHFAVVLLACVLALCKAWLVASVAATVAITLFILRMVSWRKWRNLKRSTDSISQYVSSFEVLLSLLSQTIRIIQETEVISRGYNRPAQLVPIVRIERQAGGAYQCLVLRKRVFEVCQGGILLLRKITQHLYKQYPLREELDAQRGYLAHTPLEELHQYMAQHVLAESDTEGGSGDHEQQDPTKQEHLSLESIKDGCNLLAVQNSEMLQRIALNLCPLHHTADPLRGQGPRLDDLSSLLEELHNFVSDAHSQLNWSTEFYKNQLFGQPPTRSLSRAEEKKCHPVLSSISDETHCMDLKTQAVLKRIRALGLTLEELQAELLGLPSATDLEDLIDELILVQQGIEGVRGHAQDSLEQLNRLMHPPQTTKVEERLSQSSDDDSAVLHSDPDLSNTELPEDEEEMVFEAYIPASHDDREGRGGTEPVAKLSEEERLALQALREVPVKMLKELRSVLTQRSAEKQQRREARRKRKMTSGYDKKTGPSECGISSTGVSDEHTEPVRSDPLPPPSHSTGKYEATCKHKLPSEVPLQSDVNPTTLEHCKTAYNDFSKLAQAAALASSMRKSAEEVFEGSSSEKE